MSYSAIIFSLIIKHIRTAAAAAFDRKLLPYLSVRSLVLFTIILIGENKFT